MLSNLELDGELDVIHACPCETRFRRLFPTILLVPHLFWRSGARQRTFLALGVGSPPPAFGVLPEMVVDADSHDLTRDESPLPNDQSSRPVPIRLMKTSSRRSRRR
jgi:hypothetical protein